MSHHSAALWHFPLAGKTSWGSTIVRLVRLATSSAIQSTLATTCHHCFAGTGSTATVATLALLDSLRYRRFAKTSPRTITPRMPFVVGEQTTKTPMKASGFAKMV